MNSVTVPISSNTFTSDSITQLADLSVKGQIYIRLDLTDISEDDFFVSNVSIDWGDGSIIEHFSKTLVKNYYTSSIFNEVLHGKIGGNVTVTYDHVFNTLTDVDTSEYKIIVKVYSENGYVHRYDKNIIIYPESFYDSLQDLRILTTQISPSSDNFTVANIESATGKTFITQLGIEPVIYSDLAVNLIRPHIVGNPWNGQLLSASPGAWTKMPLDYSYQWKINGVSIVGAFFSTWTTDNIKDADIINCDVSAFTDSGLSLPRTSNNLIGIEAPYNIIAPILSGVPIVSSSITTDHGVFGGSTSVKDVQWRRDNVILSGEVTDELVLSTLPSLSHNTQIRSCVAATNAAGSAFNCSNIKYIVRKPYWIIGGSIAGTATPGLDLYATDPIWGNDPDIIAREWYRNGIPTGSTDVIYNNTSGGDSIYAVFSAYNIAGWATQSIVSNTLQMQNPPSNTVLPVIYGGIYEGGTVYATPGSWTESPIGYYYQWYINSVAIPGATLSSFIIGIGTYSKSLHVTISAYNTGGITTAESVLCRVELAPINDFSSYYFENSARRGIIRTAAINTGRTADNTSYYFENSARRGALREALLRLPAIQADDVSYYFVDSKQKGGTRYAEQIVSQVADVSSYYFIKAAVRGKLQ